MNQVAGDGCSLDCTFEGGGAGPACGNNVVEAGEECDDGNADNGDGCGQCSVDIYQVDTNGAEFFTQFAPENGEDFYEFTATETFDLTIATFGPDGVCDQNDAIIELYRWAGEGYEFVAFSGDGIDGTPCASMRQFIEPNRYSVVIYSENNDDLSYGIRFEFRR